MNSEATPCSLPLQKIYKYFTLDIFNQYIYLTYQKYKHVDLTLRWQKSYNFFSIKLIWMFCSYIIYWSLPTLNVLDLGDAVVVLFMISALVLREADITEVLITWCASCAGELGWSCDTSCDVFCDYHNLLEAPPGGCLTRVLVWTLEF